MLTHAFMFKSCNKYLFKTICIDDRTFLGRILDPFDGGAVCMQAKTSCVSMNNIEY